MALSEFELIRRYFDRPGDPARGVRIGVGDDGAVLEVPPEHALVATTDALVAGVHFPQGVAPADLGFKSLAVNLSDLAAMGAEPAWCLLSLTMPEVDEAWLEAFAAGFRELEQASGARLVGGDLTRGPLLVCVHALGIVPRGAALRRGGARAGDDVYVSGTLGDASAALRLKEDRADVPAPLLEFLRARLARPEPRLALGRALRRLASSAIDVSDGFAADLGHILEASGVGATIEAARLPSSPALVRVLPPDAVLECMLHGGDDYELCFTAAPADRAAVERLAESCDCAVSRVGRIELKSGLFAIDGDRKWPIEPSGFRHF
jgi:thiamine-monophosphate kinase